MFRNTLQFLSLLSVLAFGLTTARAQDDKPDPAIEATKQLLNKAEEEYRLFIRRPESIYDYWAAMKYEMQVGKFDIAALHLKLMLEQYDKKPEAGVKDLTKIEAAEGLSSILNLRRVKKWSDFPPFQKEAAENVEKLVDRITEALEKHYGDRERIQKFIKRLDAKTPEERAFARMQLMKSNTRAVPYLVEGLRVNFGKALYDRIRDLLLEMDSEAVAAYLEVLRANNPDEAKEPEPRLTLLDIAVKRGEKRVVPYLWHLSSAPQYPGNVRQAAKKALATFLRVDEVNLPPAKIALTELAEDYYYHRVRFPTKAAKIWPWDGKALAVVPIELTPTQAEEFFGLRYARQALDLDAKHRPAQVALLNMMLERNLEPNLDQLLLAPMPPGLKNLLVTLDPELVGIVLDKAMDDRKIPAILATVQTLGERGDVRAAKLGAGGAPRGLLRALYFPDRRVQFAAAQATLRMPSVPPVASARVVDIYRRMLAADPAKSRALALYIPADKNDTRAQLQAVGYDTTIAPTLKEGIEKLREAADFEFILLHRALPEKELPFVLTQIRGDVDQGGLPIFIVASKDREESLKKLVGKYRAVEVLPEAALALPEIFKASIEATIKASQGAKLTVEERKEFGRVALGALKKMSRGEYAGYDVRPAEEAIAGALRSPDSALDALEILGRLPGAGAQKELTSFALDPARDKLRVGAAKELNRHIQKYGFLLGKKYAEDLKTTYDGAADPALKGELAVVVGLMRTPNPQQAGAQLIQFRPDVAPPPMEKKEEK